MSVLMLSSGKLRNDWLVDELRRLNSRIDEKSRRAKFSTMAKTMQAFFRGSAQLYWHDLGQSSLVSEFGGADTCLWICGDLHLGNLGSFHDADGTIVFDINDFDEGVVADYQLDLWRLCTSIMVTSQQQSSPRYAPADLMQSCLRGYLDAIRTCRKHPRQCRTQLTADSSSGTLHFFLKEVAATHSRTQMLETWTMHAHGATVLAVHENSDLQLPPHPVIEAIAEGIRDYAKQQATLLCRRQGPHIASIATRLHAGLGAYGLARYYVLIAEPKRDQMLILDLKSQPTPSAWPYLAKNLRRRTSQASDGDSGRRVVTAQRMLTSQTDPYLGHIQLEGAAFSVRERSPWKAALPNDDYDHDCLEQVGGLVARAHARSSRAFPLSLHRRLRDDPDRFIAHTIAVASAYAEQVRKDWMTFRSRLRHGML